MSNTAISNDNKEKVRIELDKYLYDPKCHFQKTHFKIGAKLHSEDFYYAKPLFQNSSFANYFADEIVEKIKYTFKIKADKKILLIGYEMYSELLLSLVSKTLKNENNGFKHIKHCVGIDNDGDFSFQPNDYVFWHIENNKNELLEECIAIIIVPIASTGSTAIKIEEAVEKEVKLLLKKVLENKNKNYTEDDLEKEISKEIKNIHFSYEEENNYAQKKDYVINAIAAQDGDKEETMDLIKVNKSKQINLIKLKANWHSPNKCKYCGLGDNDDFKETRPLFSTDKSYLTPSLIFNLPKGKIIKEKKKDKVYVDKFGTELFTNSLIYKNVRRNNEFFLFSVNSPKFIEHNNTKITDWLKSLNQEFKNSKKSIIEYHKNNIKDFNKIQCKEFNPQEDKEKYFKRFFEKCEDVYKVWNQELDSEIIEIKEEDTIFLLSPCHETNSTFLNLVNEHVFNSKATIIYHKTDTDYIENFKPLYKELFENKNSNFFYVDDNLISGKQFFEIYHLFRDTVGDKKKLTGAILLRDSSTQETHDRFLRAVNQCRSFVAYNLPPSLSIDDKKPLEHERKRFADLQKFALHDVMIKRFNDKEQELNVEKDKKGVEKDKKDINITDEEKEDYEKDRETRYLNMFVTTHRIFEYFTFNPNKENIDYINLLNHCYGEKESEKEHNIDDRIVLLKVLGQYPFILYKPLKEMAFEWHKKWLKSFWTSNKININIKSYDKFLDNFKEFKFLIRRAVFLENLEIVDTLFLKLIILEAFPSTDIALKDNNLEYFTKRNYEDFPIFLVRTYLELAHKNGWAAVKLINNIKNIEKEEELENHNAKKFLRMLKIELAAVVTDFYEMITKQYDIEWRDIYKKERKLEPETIKICNFFDVKKNKDKHEKLIVSNKYEISKQVLGINNQIKTEDTPFINFLWIKQLIHNDTHKRPYFPKEATYQGKINYIIDKMKRFFPIKDIQAFFIVTDGQQTPYVVSDNENILDGFEVSNKILISIKKLWNLYRKENNKETKTKLKTKLEAEIKVIKNAGNKILIDFLNGKDDNNYIAKETTAEYHRVDNKWNDCYNSKKNKIKLGFIDDKTKWLYLIRLSELKDGEFRTLGLLGFYCSEDLYSSHDSLLPKQLLMLLRQDMGKFINKHHKNDEFAKLREEEIKNRYAYLAGHGRLTLQRLAFNDANSKFFVPFVRTIEKLQFIFATKYHSTQNELIKDFEPSEITKETIDIGFGSAPIGIKKLAELIYITKNIENNIDIEDVDIEINTDKFSTFFYNKEILFCICFELIWNAKKNIFHFLECEKKVKNRLSIFFETSGTDLCLTFKSTGTEFNNNIANNINNHRRLKAENEQEGLHFINSLIHRVSKGSELRVTTGEDIKILEKCQACTNKEICSVYENEIKVTLKMI